MRQSARQWVLFILRWGIAAVGIIWVLGQMSFRDYALVLDEDNRPVRAVVTSLASEDASSYEILDPHTGQRRVVSAARVVNPPQRPGETVQIVTAEGRQTVQLLALDLDRDLTRVRRLLVASPVDGTGQWVVPERIVGGYVLGVPRPRIEIGVASLVRRARPAPLWAAVLVFPLTFILTSYRWHALLRALDITITRTRAFVLNMVGFFYSTFMPGSTGGDLLKAYYASRQTPHRHRAVISVIVDRAIGLLSLIVLGGSMAALQYLTAVDPTTAAAVACRRIALASAAVLAGTMLLLVVLGHSGLRRRVGFDFLLARLPMQRHVQHVIEALRMYRSRPGLALWAMLVTLPVHMTVVISAMLAGTAFGLPLPRRYYFVAVPVIVLSGALPIAPQGAGVMEFFAVHLTRQYGATVSQAFALTMSIRLVQMLWNLTGGIFVLRGGYHAPTAGEQQELESEVEELPQQRP